MALNISVQCKNQVYIEIGDHNNMYFLPKIADQMINLCTYMPLWSGVMCTSFKYGDIPPSSASIESQFNDLKNRVLRHVSIPMRIDNFLKIHMKSINGTMKLTNSKLNSVLIEPCSFLNNNESSQILSLSQPNEIHIDTGSSQNTVSFIKFR